MHTLRKQSMPVLIKLKTITIWTCHLILLSVIIFRLSQWEHTKQLITIEISILSHCMSGINQFSRIKVLRNKSAETMELEYHGTFLVLLLRTCSLWLMTSTSWSLGKFWVKKYDCYKSFTYLIYFYLSALKRKRSFCRQRNISF